LQWFRSPCNAFLRIGNALLQTRTYVLFVDIVWLQAGAAPRSTDIPPTPIDVALLQADMDPPPIDIGSRPLAPARCKLTAVRDH
jgi:hypothetical protein